MYLILINSVILLAFYIVRTFFNRSDVVYLLFGAQYGPLVTNNGEWFRIVTAMFMHGGFLHLAFNMYALYILGNYVEAIYGSARFISYYFITGIVGNVATHLFYYDALSVGASGAIFGLVGTLFGAGFRKDTPFYLRPITGSALLPMIIINIALGFVPGSAINNAAHIGGLLTGMALGYFIPVGLTQRVERFWRAVAVALISLVIVSFGLLIRSNFFN
ncbi:rhomboid family intramembrane serine protease [Fervidobacterium thailandense]|uniref:Rhomboid family intramembrane serine protease n=1 Tax=Fervidobacterium thailandense TaxID=1008305 RepID=A0A1E3G6G5_9BACT|nr:rhomboid family intramembrane serine protease [Fervidobacterium thailandense]ODN31463.1 rhomboid family intramembrane serine protease [Fervidobacterium thailandense]